MRNKDISFHNFKALTKKMKKFEKAYDEAEGQPVLQARIERSALAVQKRLKEYETGEEVKDDTIRE